MRTARAALLGLGLALAALGPRPASAEDVPPERRAFVAITAARDTVHVGEPVRLRLRFGLDAAWFEAHAVPLVRHRMDLPVQVLAPATDALAGAVRRPAPSEDAAAAARVRFVLNDGPGLAGAAPVETRDDRPFAVYEVEVAYLPEAPGVLVVPPPTLRFAYATRFERDFAGGRVPVDRTDVRVPGPAPSIRVLPLPEEGRPAGFRGAVGRFTATAALEASSPVDAKRLRLVLRIAGEGNLEAFDTPRLDGLDGFHVEGALDDRGRAVRTIRYDLARVRDGVAEVPPIPLETFDPGPPAGYRTVRTAAIPLAPPPAPATPGTPSPDGARSRGGDGEPGAGTGGARGAVLAALVAVLGAALAFGLARRRRARAAAGGDPAHARVLAALEALRVLASRPGSELADPFAEVLAARLDCAPAAVVAPDLEARLAAAGVPADAAARAATLLEGLVGARYGGDAPTVAGGDLLAVAERVVARSKASAPGGVPR